MKSVIIIGGGIVGLAIARQLTLKGYRNLTILEKESDIVMHQSSRNSGVMHAGLYYKPGSLKQRLSREGIKLMKDYCNTNNINWNECGKIVVATNSTQEQNLDELFEIGIKNNLKNIEKIASKEISKIEPYINAYKAIRVPEESIVSYKEVAHCFLKEILSNGGLIKYNSKVIDIENDKNDLKRLKISTGEYLKANIIIAASGLYSDKVSKLLEFNVDNLKIIPFRGEYYKFKHEFNYLVNNLVYPLPDKNFPFLGTHLTKMVDGVLEAGPNAVLALAREGYTWKVFNLSEFIETVRFEGLRKFIFKYPKTTLNEFKRSLFKSLFVKDLKQMLPDLNENMLEQGASGVRAQLMQNNGELIKDFDIRIKSGIITVLNAPSPAATSSIAIANYVIKYADL